MRYTHSGMRTDDVLSMDVTSYGVSKGIAQAAGSYFFHKDGLGSVIEITNSSGNIIQHYVYSSFGKILKIMNGSVDNTANPLIKTNFAYTNREYDSESGLYYYRARYYAPDLGRFLTEDPHPGILRNPATFNTKYTYVSNNPVNYTDPSGKFFIVAAWVGSSVLVAALNTAITVGLANVTLQFLNNQASGKSYNGWDALGAFGTGFLSGLVMPFFAGQIGYFAAGAISSGIFSLGTSYFNDGKLTGREVGQVGASMLLGGYLGHMGTVVDGKIGQFLIDYTGALSDSAVQFFGNDVADLIRQIKGNEPKPTEGE
ncbi:MAG: RHS repeat domain-containing protein [Bacteriovoracaceae bacterium]